jgi:hypothetical protein
MVAVIIALFVAYLYFFYRNTPAPDVSFDGKPVQVGQGALDDQPQMITPKAPCALCHRGSEKPPYPATEESQGHMSWLQALKSTGETLIGPSDLGPMYHGELPLSQAY